MKVTILNAYSNKKESFSGEPEQIKSQLLARYPYLQNRGLESFHDVVAKLSNTQAFFVEVEE
jgi:hypothetical protein